MEAIQILAGNHLDFGFKWKLPDFGFEMKTAQILALKFKLTRSRNGMCSDVGFKMKGAQIILNLWNVLRCGFEMKGAQIFALKWKVSRTWL